jgi:hypothetical protein
MKNARSSDEGSLEDDEPDYFELSRLKAVFDREVFAPHLRLSTFVSQHTVQNLTPRIFKGTWPTSHLCKGLNYW